MHDWSDHIPIIRAKVLSVGVPFDDRDDVVQDTLIQLGKYDPETTQFPKALARKVAHDLAVTYRRQKTNRSKLRERNVYKYSDEEYGVDTSGQVLQDSENLELLTKDVSPEHNSIIVDYLQKALDSITPEQREAVVLIDLLGYTYQEASAKTGVSRQAFHRRHQRARKGIERWKQSS
jgi:RNA polymerase sigma factor (sigma-70 family)